MRQAFGTTFAVDGVYLNTPSIGVPPQPVVEAVGAAVASWGRAERSAPEFDAAVALSVLVLGFAFVVILTARYLTRKAAEVRG